MKLLDGEAKDDVVQLGFHDGTKAQYDLVVIDKSPWLHCASVKSRSVEPVVDAISTELIDVISAPYTLVEGETTYYFSEEISMVNAYELRIPDTSRVLIDFKSTIGAYDE